MTTPTTSGPVTLEVDELSKIIDFVVKVDTLVSEYALGISNAMIKYDSEILLTCDVYGSWSVTFHGAAS